MEKTEDTIKLHKIISDEIKNDSEQNDSTFQRNVRKQRFYDISNVLLNPLHLNLIVDIFWEKHKDSYPFQVGGIDISSIPLVSAIIMKSVEKGKPVNGFIIRKSRREKKEGFQNLISGNVSEEPIILVDNVINTGKTYIRQLEILEDRGKTVTEISSILRLREIEDYAFITTRNTTISSFFTPIDFGEDMLSSPEPMPRYNPFDVNWYFKSDNPNFFYLTTKSTPVLDDTRLYFGSDNGYFWALDKKTGTVVWKYKVGFNAQGEHIFSTPALHNEMVYFGSHDGNVYGLDASTGKKKWIFMEADWVRSSPVIAKDLNLLFIGLQYGLFKKHGGIVALDLKTGKKKWEYSMPEFTLGSPTYSSNRKIVAIGSNDGVAYLFNAKNGTLLWKHQTGGEIKAAPVFDEKRNCVIYCAYDGSVNFFDIDSGKLLHLHKTKFAIASAPLITDTHIYFTSFDKHVHCIDLNSFEEIWTFNTTSRALASPVLIEGKILAGSSNGCLYEIDASTGRELSFFQVTERITNQVVYDTETKHIFLSTDANEIYCLNRKEDDTQTE